MEITLQPLNITKELILSKVSEEQIFEHYGVKVQKGLFCSKLRQDKRPTVAFYKNKRGRLMLKDFGDGSCLDCFGYVQAMFDVSYYMSLQIIANDFGIIKRPDLNIHQPKYKYSGVKFEERESAIIQIQTRQFNQKELNWWLRYGINGSTLKKFKVFPVDSVWLNENLFYQNVDNKPVFAYYGGIRDGIEQWRIYYPNNTKYRFISNWKANQIQGANMLPKEGGDFIVITKSLKDVMCLYEFGITAIAPCSENLFVTDNQYTKIKEKFKNIYLLYDNDRPGIHAAWNIRKKYPDVKCLILNPKDAKDISDYRKAFGYKKTLDLINKVKDYYGET